MLQILKESLRKKEFFKDIRLVFIFFTVLLFIVYIVIIYGYGTTPDTSFIALGFTLFSLAIASHAVVIAIESDEKMKSIATGDFFEITYRFWDRAPILYIEQIKEVRDTQSWQLVNLFRHGEKLKGWADSDIQDQLIQYFKTFLERLRLTKCDKYWVEIKNYLAICKIAIDFKTKNDDIKNELIDELGNWLGNIQERKSNQEYLTRKSNEFSKKKKYEVFKL